MIRVTTLSMEQKRLADILRGQERLDDAQSRVSSGLRIAKPSDAPDQISELLRVQSDIAQNTSLSAAIDAIMPISKTADTALGEITNSLRQIKTLATQAINATTNDDQRAVIANQIGQIIDSIRTAANTNLGGKYVFA